MSSPLPGVSTDVLIRAGSSTAMLRDDNTSGGGQRPARNVLGEPLEICSFKPMTGFYRDGCCNTGQEDIGSHTVCAVMTSAFLDFSKLRGNDLSTPVPEFGFPGLKPGDRWCLCAGAAARGPARHSRECFELLLTHRSQAVRSRPSVTSFLKLSVPEPPVWPVASVVAAAWQNHAWHWSSQPLLMGQLNYAVARQSVGPTRKREPESI
jgi:uncharacterized protein (DUF2237 family)